MTANKRQRKAVTPFAATKAAPALLCALSAALNSHKVHYRMFKNIFVLGFACASSLASASDPINWGKIEDLSYRGGWVMFKVVDSQNKNLCEACPTDPGALNSKSCWTQDTKNVQISMLLSAQARDKKIMGRVNSVTADCNLYQMIVEN